jgi:hypothetical protein
MLQKKLQNKTFRSCTWKTSLESNELESNSMESFVGKQPDDFQYLYSLFKYCGRNREIYLLWYTASFLVTIKL